MLTRPGGGRTSARPPHAGPVVSATGVVTGYRGERVLDGVDLSVEAGEVVALLGPSGSGKSTLLYCLSGVLVPEQGRVVVAGTDLTAADDADRTRFRRESCGFVLQFGRLVPDLTAVENVSLPLRLLGVRRGEAERAAAEALAEVGLEDRAAQRAATLSGGEQQRAAVARALIHRPAVVFADEPTGALDSANGRVVLDLLVASARDRGASVLLVTHDESLIGRVDRCVRLLDGRVNRSAGR